MLIAGFLLLSCITALVTGLMIATGNPCDEEW